MAHKQVYITPWQLTHQEDSAESDLHTSWWLLLLQIEIPPISFLTLSFGMPEAYSLNLMNSEIIYIALNPS